MEFHLLHTFSDKVDYLDYFILLFTLIGFQIVIHLQEDYCISQKKGTPKRVRYLPS